MALMSWKHIETQSLFCTGLHESKWWKHQVLGNLVNESIKLSLSRFGAKHQLLALAVFHNLHAFETCPKQVSLQSLQGSLNPKSFIMGSEFWIRSCFQEAFFKTATKQQLTCWWARWGGFFDSSFLRLEHRACLLTLLCRKTFKHQLLHQSKCHWLNLLRII